MMVLSVLDQNCYIRLLMRSTRRVSRLVTAALAVATLCVTWWWPGLSGHGSGADVLIVPDPVLVEARNAIDRRLREEGLTTSWNAPTDIACRSHNASLRAAKVVVVAVPEPSTCSSSDVLASLLDLRRRIESTRIVTVFSWRSGESDAQMVEQLVRNGFSPVDARPLLGAPGQEQACLWWDDCPASGKIVTVDGGGLTEAGKQRVARTIVAGVVG